MGADSIAIKDMAGLLSPYDCYELVSGLKSSLDSNSYAVPRTTVCRRHLSQGGRGWHR